MSFGFNSLDQAMFSIAPIVVTVGFVAILGFMLVFIVKAVAQWNQNNHSPVLSVSARDVTKRMSVYERMEPVGGDQSNMRMTSDTWYYASFEVESGDRMEFSISEREYELLAEGDEGTLTFQGTRYQGFKRVQ